MSALLTLEGVGVRYGKAEAVRNVSLEVATGQIVTVIGPNGAGKTTLLTAAMGLLPFTGRIAFDGADIGDLETEERVERGLCLVPEKRELFTDMSVIDNLRLGAYIRRDKAVGSGSRRACSGAFPASPSGASRARARCRAASGRCSRSGAR